MMRREKLRKTFFYGWAIDPNNGKHGLIGKWWWFGSSLDVPISMSAYPFALFRTREQARNNLKYVRRSFPKAKVIKLNFETDEY